MGGGGTAQQAGRVGTLKSWGNRLGGSGWFLSSVQRSGVLSQDLRESKFDKANSGLRPVLPLLYDLYSGSREDSAYGTDWCIPNS